MMAKVKAKTAAEPGAFFLIGLRRPGNLVIIRQILLRNLFHQLDRITRAYARGAASHYFCRKQAIDSAPIARHRQHCADPAQRGQWHHRAGLRAHVHPAQILLGSCGTPVLPAVAHGRCVQSD